MAITLNPLYSMNPSGSYAGIVIQRHNGISHIRARIKPITSRSTRSQTIKKNNFMVALKSWSNLSLADHVKWQSFSRSFTKYNRFGTTQTLNAFNWFMKMNLNSINYFEFTNVTPPSTPLINYFPKIDLLWTAAGVEMTFLPSIPVDHAIVVFQVRTGNTAKKQPLTQQLSHIITTGSGSPTLLTPPCGNGGGPGDLPPFNCGEWIQFSIMSANKFGQTSVKLFFNVQSS